MLFGIWDQFVILDALWLWIGAENSQFRRYGFSLGECNIKSKLWIETIQNETHTEMQTQTHI